MSVLTLDSLQLPACVMIRLILTWNFFLAFYRSFTTSTDPSIAIFCATVLKKKTIYFLLSADQNRSLLVIGETEIYMIYC